MKKLIPILLPLFSITSIFLQGCIKDSLTTTYYYTLYTPVYKSKAEVRAEVKSGGSQSLQHTGKLYIYGNYIFLNEVDKGIHVIDNSNPAQPTNLAFINIPGNRDLAVFGNFLYADLYTDLVVLDISNPRQVQATKIMENVFPHRRFDNGFVADTNMVITSWIARDTVVKGKHEASIFWDKSFFAMESSARSNSGASAPSPAGQGGSMARFALAASTLYTVGYEDLKSFDLATPSSPNFTSKQHIGWNIETIFPFKDKLFIGSATGMYIYDIAIPSKPVKLSAFQHVRSCDPVIADGQHAFVTLRSGNTCMGFTNQLEVLNIADLTKPSLLQIYPMTNPHGLSKDGNLLFICDGRGGLKIFDAKNVNNLQHVKTISGIETYDVIAWNGVALVVAKDGLYQYDYSNPDNIKLISKIPIVK